MDDMTFEIDIDDLELIVELIKDAKLPIRDKVKFEKLILLNIKLIHIIQQAKE